ncbi:hypothetical protein [Sphingobacterium multivorum]|uniref:hypothetical protein n=1 Tax=Sphingobacterium multivorum TaxID=28454 RepID=UPI0028A8919E|nr:hypothetical protein [Sphingobacterium multivorum]
MEIISKKHLLIYYNVNIQEINHCSNLLMQSKEWFDLNYVENEYFVFSCNWERRVIRKEDDVELIKLKSMSIIKFVSEIDYKDFSPLNDILKMHEEKNIQIIKDNNMNFSEHNENIYYSIYLDSALEYDNSEFSFNNQIKELVKKQMRSI